MFPYDFITGPCETVQIELPSDAKFKDIAGTFKLRSGETTNGRQDWLSINEKYAMWYVEGREYDFWTVSYVKDRGTNRAIMYTTEAHYSPVEVDLKWKYVKSTGGFSNPTDAVKVTCKGK